MVVICSCLPWIRSAPVAQQIGLEDKSVFSAGWILSMSMPADAARSTTTRDIFSWCRCILKLTISTCIYLSCFSLLRFAIFYRPIHHVFFCCTPSRFARCPSSGPLHYLHGPPESYCFLTSTLFGPTGKTSYPNLRPAIVRSVMEHKSL